MEREGPVIVVDFDNTITTRDIGDEICDRFAPPAWRELDRAWLNREMSLPDAQVKIWAMVKATRDEAVAFTRSITSLRDGFADFATRARAQGIPLVLASGGFDFYIEPLLGPLLDCFSAAYYNRADITPEGTTIEFADTALSCPKCAVCKGRIVERERIPGRTVVFVGDGASDRCAINVADTLYAVRGGNLEREAPEAGTQVRVFDSFLEVMKDLLPD